MTAPSDVPVFTAEQFGSSMLISWEEPSDKDIVGYEIRVGDTWDTGEVLISGVSGTLWSWTTFTIGTFNLMIKAIDRSGNYSVDPAETEIIVTKGPDVTVEAAQDGLNPIPASFSGAAWQQWAALGMYAVGLTPSQGWDDAGVWDDGSTWDLPVAGVSGSFVSDVLDVGTIGNYQIAIISDFQNDDGAGVSLIEIATSLDNITWGSYSTFAAGTAYQFRYVRFRLTLTADSVNANILATEFDITILVQTPKPYVVTSGVSPTQQQSVMVDDQLGNPVIVSTVVT